MCVHLLLKIFKFLCDLLSFICRLESTFSHFEVFISFYAFMEVLQKIYDLYHIFLFISSVSFLLKIRFFLTIPVPMNKWISPNSELALPSYNEKKDPCPAVATMARIISLIKILEGLALNSLYVHFKGIIFRITQIVWLLIFYDLFYYFYWKQLCYINHERYII